MYMGTESCSIDGCTKPVKALGLCFPHYQRQRREARGDHKPRVALDAPVTEQIGDLINLGGLYMLTDEAALLERAAKKAGISTFAFVRQAVETVAERIEKGGTIGRKIQRRIDYPREGYITQQGSKSVAAVRIHKPHEKALVTLARRHGASLHLLVKVIVQEAIGAPYAPRE